MASGPYQQGMPAPPGMEKFIRPEHVARASFLPNEQKVRYQAGILQLWNRALSSSETSGERIQACQKLSEVTQNLHNQNQKYRQAQAAQQQQQQSSPAATTPQSQPAQNLVQAQQAQQQPIPQAARPVSQDQQQPQSNQTSGGAAAASKKALALKEELKHLLQNLVLPPNSNPAEAQKWLEQNRSQAVQAIRETERSVNEISMIQKQVIEKQRQSPLTDQDKAKVQEKLQETYVRLNKLIEAMLRLKEVLSRSQRPQTGGAPTQPGAAGQQGQENASQNQHQPQIKNEPIDQSVAGLQNPVAASPAQNPQTSQPSQALSAAAAAAAARPVPPQVNVPTKADPARPMPQPVQALSHQDALDKARSYQHPPTQTPTSGHHPVMNRADSHTSSQAPSRMQMSNQNKNLSVTPLQPVAMDASRPTLSRGAGGSSGVMNQPGLQRHPGYVLEGEGERVLSEKKLEELVREVTGSGGGEGAESLDSEVRETLLDLADEFIDNVVMAACKVAKLRNSSTLDLRDIQLILERNYNIRVPGYASDELRTVKKIQPSQAWAQKMSAVQAAKVTGGKTDS